VAIGYSGYGRGKNNPDWQTVPDFGPIPVGFYNIQDPRDTDKHGPYVLPLAPFTENKMWGRSGFLMHGDSKEEPGMASHGCTIFARAVRELIWGSDDHQLEVISGLTPAALPSVRTEPGK
jgi:hypothetical protein